MSPVILSPFLRPGAVAERRIPAPRSGAESLAFRPDPALRALAARDAFCPPEVLALLARDAHASVRHAAATHPQLPRTTMVRIAESGADAALCAHLALNPSAPVQALRLLAKHADPDVRAASARNPYQSPAVLARLSEDPEVAVRISARSALARRA